MIGVVCFLWPPKYGPEHVNTLRNALDDRLPVAHRLICVTKDATGLDRRIQVVAPDTALPDSKRFRKLMLFRRDAAKVFGADRLLGIDLDVTPVGDLGPLVDREEDFVIWRDPLFGREGYAPSHRYNSSLILMDAGARPQVYETFDAASSGDAIRSSGFVGSDQAFIGLTLGPDEAVWTQEDGVLGFKHDLGWHPWSGQFGRDWPEHARLIVSHGLPKPWGLTADHPLRIAYERHTEQVAA